MTLKMTIKWLVEFIINLYIYICFLEKLRTKYLMKKIKAKENFKFLMDRKAKGL